MCLSGFRLIGLCLLQNELCPIFLNRHVMKYILGRPIRFHDLAFFDPVIYESLRQLVVDAETKDSNSLFSALDLTFRYVFKVLHWKCAFICHYNSNLTVRLHSLYFCFCSEIHCNLVILRIYKIHRSGCSNRYFQLRTIQCGTNIWIVM